jgi:aryl-alcohol dehydrogenase-like predicted oxidoreductase
MKYNQMGKTGVLVSELCLGTMTFGGVGRWEAIGKLQQNEVNQLVKTAIDQGINFIDTANAYSEGLSETLLGAALKKLGVPRQQVVIATKVRLRMGPGANQTGLSRLHIADSIDDSLDRLGMPHIDLLYIHGVDLLTPLEETMRGLEDAVCSGKVRYIGISNHPAWMVAKANGIADAMGWTAFAALQYFYSIASRDVEREIIPMAISEGLGFMPWSPLAGGFLSGKYSRNKEKAGDSRRDAFDFPPLNKEKAYDIIDVMMKIGTDRGVSVAQVALAWLLRKPAVTSVIIGAKNRDQLTDNIDAVRLNLTAEEMRKLDEVSALTVEYPAWMVDRQMQDRMPLQ